MAKSEGTEAMTSAMDGQEKLKQAREELKARLAKQEKEAKQRLEYVVLPTILVAFCCGVFYFIRQVYREEPMGWGIILAVLAGAVLSGGPMAILFHFRKERLSDEKQMEKNRQAARTSMWGAMAFCGPYYAYKVFYLNEPAGVWIMVVCGASGALFLQLVTTLYTRMGK